MIIYKATNLINGKIYIGQTTEDFSERIRKHWASARSNKKIINQRHISKMLC